MNIALALILTNALRSTPLKLNGELTALAESRAEYLCKHPFSHAGWKPQALATGYGFVGENLAKGFDTLPATYAAWDVSPEHRLNLTDTDYEYTGIAEACGVTIQEFGGY